MMNNPPQSIVASNRSKFPFSRGSYDFSQKQIQFFSTMEDTTNRTNKYELKKKEIKHLNTPCVGKISNGHLNVSTLLL